MRSVDDDATRAGHRTLPHTADLIVEAWAPTRAGCLAEAVAALTDSYADTSHAEPTRRHGFRLAAATDEQALVALLDEALYVLDALGAVPVETHLDTPGDAELSGWFALVDVDRVTLIGSVPKGVALSGLSLRHLDGRWHCTATVDV